MFTAICRGTLWLKKKADESWWTEKAALPCAREPKFEPEKKIGRVGMTGSTTGPHLHWGLKYDGVWVDPAVVIKAMYDSQ